MRNSNISEKEEREILEKLRKGETVSAEQLELLLSFQNSFIDDREWIETLRRVNLYSVPASLHAFFIKTYLERSKDIDPEDRIVNFILISLRSKPNGIETTGKKSRLSAKQLEAQDRLKYFNEQMLLNFPTEHQKMYLKKTWKRIVDEKMWSHLSSDIDFLASLVIKLGHHEILEEIVTDGVQILESYNVDEGELLNVQIRKKIEAQLSIYRAYDSLASQKWQAAITKLEGIADLIDQVNDLELSNQYYTLNIETLLLIKRFEEATMKNKKLISLLHEHEVDIQRIGYAYALLADLQSQTGHVSEAIDTYHKGLTLDSEQIENYPELYGHLVMEMGFLFISHSRKEMAEEKFKQRLSNIQPTILLRKYIDQVELTDSFNISNYEKARLYLLLGMLYNVDTAHTDNKRKGISALKQALEIARSNERIHKAEDMEKKENDLLTATICIKLSETYEDMMDVSVSQRYKKMAESYMQALKQEYGE